MNDTSLNDTGLNETYLNETDLNDTDNNFLFENVLQITLPLGTQSNTTVVTSNNRTQNQNSADYFYSEVLRLLNIPGDLSNNSSVSQEANTISMFDSDVNEDYIHFIDNLLRNRTGQQNNTQLLHSSLHDQSQNIYKNVISEKGMGSITPHKFDSITFQEQKTCSITLLDFKENDDISQLPCGHIFHSDAILKWLKNEDSRCPVCRKGVDSIEVKKENEIPTRAPSTHVIRQMINNRIRHEENVDLQMAIMASMREIDMRDI